MSTPEQLVEGCVTLVHHIARQYASQNRNISLEDLVSEGYLGLVQAAQKFEEGRGVKFSTFATTRIRGAMLDSMRRGRPLSRPMAEKVAKVTSLSEQATASSGQEPSRSEIARKLRLSPQKTEEVFRMQSLRLVSLDLETEGLHHDFADAEETPEEQAIQSVLQEELRGHVACLMPRDREIIRRIYWLREKHSKVAQDLGISESRVSQLQTRAIARLREVLTSDDQLKAA